MKRILLLSLAPFAIALLPVPATEIATYAETPLPPPCEPTAPAARTTLGPKPPAPAPCEPMPR